METFHVTLEARDTVSLGEHAEQQVAALVSQSFAGVSDIQTHYIDGRALLALSFRFEAEFSEEAERFLSLATDAGTRLGALGGGGWKMMSLAGVTRW